MVAGLSVVIGFWILFTVMGHLGAYDLLDLRKYFTYFGIAIVVQHYLF